MPVEIFFHTRHRLPVNKLKKALEALLETAGLRGAWLGLNLVGKKRIQTLNRKYRHKDRWTDVLSFPIDPSRPNRNFPWHLGEIVLCVPVASAQARQSGRSLSDQVIRLALHGVVHLMGWDHEKSPKEKNRFEKEEKRILAFLNRKGWISWDGSLPF